VKREIQELLAPSSSRREMRRCLEQLSARLTLIDLGKTLEYLKRFVFLSRCIVQR
jgi:hypothetical protein